MKANISLLRAWALLAAGMFFAATSRAATVEGFETLTLDATNSIGDASIRTPNYFSILPTEGTHELLLTTISTVAAHDPGPNQSGTNAASVTSLATFFGITAANIRDGTVTGQEGSGFKLSLGPLNVGDVITFNYDFLTNDFFPGGHNDFAFATLTAGNVLVVADELAPAQTSTSDGSNPFALETGYLTYQITITTAATYTLGIGVVDGTTFDTTSALLVDNISVIPFVPEPSAVGLGLAGAVLLIALRSRFKKA
jgi:hypothetical protein